MAPFTLNRRAVVEPEFVSVTPNGMAVLEPDFASVTLNGGGVVEPEFALVTLNWACRGGTEFRIGHTKRKGR